MKQGIPKAYNGTDPFIFVSYSHRDADIVYPMIAGLQARGLRIWYDEGIEPSEDFMEIIARRIQECYCFMGFVSPAYLESAVSDSERKYAYKLRKRLLLVYLQNVSPAPGFVMMFDNIQALFRADFDSDALLLDKIAGTNILAPCSQRSVTDEADQADQTYMLGQKYYQEKNWELAASYFRIAAEAGHAGAQFFMGVCRSSENPYLKKSLAAAAKWYILAVEQGHAGAINNLAFFYWKGLGVEKDLNMAVELFRKASSLGNPAAKANLIHCLKEIGQTSPQ